MDDSYTCEGCGAHAGPAGVHCNTCQLDLLEGLLGCPTWCRIRGVTPGDLPGETLADTLRRELASLNA